MIKYIEVETVNKHEKIFNAVSSENSIFNWKQFSPYVRRSVNFYSSFRKFNMCITFWHHMVCDTYF